jgi:hypothetical protein
LSMMRNRFFFQNGKWRIMIRHCKFIVANPRTSLRRN